MLASKLKESFKYITPKVTKTYACKKATPSSKAKTKTNIQIEKKNKNQLKIANLTQKSNKVINKTWPAVILAVKRKLKLNNLIIYEQTSIKHIKGNNALSTLGTKKFKKPKPNKLNPL